MFKFLATSFASLLYRIEPISRRLIMNGHSKVKIRTVLILLLVLLPGFLTLQTLYATNLPYLSISLSATQVALTKTIDVSGLLTGATPSAKGDKVDYNLFTGGSCSGSIVTTVTKTVPTVKNGQAIIPTATFTMNSGGTFSFQGVFEGDATNYPAKSECSAPVSVIGTPTTIKTTTTPATPATIKLGKSVKDSATLTGTNVGGTTTGTVTYELFAGSTCSGSILQSQTMMVTAGVPAGSNPFTINNAGTYSLHAVYSGDSKNRGSTSSCEDPITVTQLTPVLGILLSASTITVGQTVSAAATLTGATSTAGGTVKYEAFGGGVCGGAASDSFTVTVTNGVVPDSKNFIITSAGSGLVSFKAVYSGDKNNALATSSCMPVTVKKTTTSLSTSLSTFSISAGGFVTDTATLGGTTSGAGGTVLFELYDDGACGGSGGSIVQSQTVTVTGGSVPSVSFTISTSGSYSIAAIYSGDSNNKGVTSGCEGVVTVT